MKKACELHGYIMEYEDITIYGYLLLKRAFKFGKFRVIEQYYDKNKSGPLGYVNSYEISVMYKIIGTALKKCDRIKESIKCLERSLSICPENIGVIIILLDSYELQTNDDLIDLYILKGKKYLKKSNISKAGYYYDLILKLDSTRIMDKIPDLIDDYLLCEKMDKIHHFIDEEYEKCIPKRKKMDRKRIPKGSRSDPRPIAARAAPAIHFKRVRAWRDPLEGALKERHHE